MSEMTGGVSENEAINSLEYTDPAANIARVLDGMRGLFVDSLPASGYESSL